MVGIALEGGGARGAYQAGAYIALVNNGIKPKMIAGTSIGSLNAALMIQGDTSKMINLWLDTTTDILGINSELIEKTKSKKISLDNIKLGYENLKQILNNKGIDTSKLLDLINSNINEKKLRKSKIKYGLVTVRLKGMTPLELTIDDIPQGKVAEYILASCYLPIFSLKKIIDDNYYLDGGFYNNLPVSLLEKHGCDVIYTIRIKGIGRSKKKTNPNTKIIEIKPKTNLGSMVIFDKESNLTHMKMGYYDALKVIKNLDGYDYYFYNKPFRYYDRLIRKINPDTITKLKKKFKTDSNKEMVIKTMEYLFKEYDYNELALYDIKKEIRYLRKHNMVVKSIFKEFIAACKLF